MTLKKLSAVLTLAAILFCAALAYADDMKTSITLALASDGNILDESDEAFTITIPETLKVSAKGWNSIGNIHVEKKEDYTFSEAKKLVVTASSSNGFYLKTADGNSIPYTLKTAESDTTQTREFTFTAEDVKSGADQSIGIYITWESTQAEGTYSDTLTYNVDVTGNDTPQYYSLLTQIGDFDYFEPIFSGGTAAVSPRAKEITSDEAKALALYQAGKTSGNFYLFYGTKDEGNGNFTLLFKLRDGNDKELSSEGFLEIYGYQFYIVNE